MKRYALLLAYVLFMSVFFLNTTDAISMTLFAAVVALLGTA